MSLPEDFGTAFDAPAAPAPAEALQPTAPLGLPSDFGAALQDDEPQESPLDMVERNAHLTAGQNSSSYFQDKQVADTLGLGVDLVSRNRETTTLEAFKSNLVKVLTHAPGTAAFFAEDRHNLWAAKDEAQALAQIEQRWKELLVDPALSLTKQAAKAPFSILGSLPYNTIAAGAGALDFLETNIAGALGTGSTGAFGAVRDWAAKNSQWITENILQSDMLALSDDIKGKGLYENPELILDPEWLTYNVGEAATSLLPQLLAAKMTGGSTLIGSAIGGVQEGGDLYRELLNDGVDPQAAFTWSAFFGTTTMALNKFGLDAILGKGAIEKITSKAIKALISGGTEGVTEWLEEPFQAFSKGMAEGNPLEDVGAAVMESLKNIDVIPGAFLLGSGTSVVASVAEDRAKEEIARAAAYRDKLVETHKAIQATQVQQNDPALMEKFLGVAGLGEDVYIDGELLLQSPDLLQRLGVDQALVEDAALSGRSVRVNTAALWTRLSEQELEGLKDDIRPAPSAMSAREAESYDPVQALKDIEEAAIDAETVVAEVVQVKDRMRQTLEARGLGETLDANWELATRLSRMLSPKGDPTAFVQKLNVMADVVERQADGQMALQQDAAYAGVENQAEIEEAQRLWAEMGTESPYFKRWSGGAPVVNNADARSNAVDTYQLDEDKFIVGQYTKDIASEKAYWENDFPREKAWLEKNIKDLKNPTREEIEFAMDSGVIPPGRLGYEGLKELYDQRIQEMERKIAEAQSRIDAASAKQEGFQTGKPVVARVFHTTPMGELTGGAFDAGRLGENTKAGSATLGHFFSGSEHTAEAYGSDDAINQRGFIALSPDQKAELVRALDEEVQNLSEEVEDFQPVTADEFAAQNPEYVRDLAGDLFDVDYDTTPTETKTYEVFVSFKNPYVYDFKGERYREQSYFDIMKQAKAAGHDGVILLNTYDGGPKDNIFAIFKGNEAQIKSVNNRGTFGLGDARILYQRADAPTEQAEDRKWAKHEPERTKTGKIKGAPEWVQNDKDLAKMRREMRKFVQEGLVGRFWYENSAQAVVDMVGGDVAQAEKFIQLLAIYSPNSNVWVNSIQAVRAYTHWARGASKDTFSVGSGDGDGKATSVLYDDVAWSGRKTNSFYLNLMYDVAQRYPDELARLNVDEEVITAITQPATIDVWMARAFGYAVEQFGNDKGSGQYSFAENEVRRLTARLNREREPGSPRWTPHQVQAAVWTSIKTRYEIQEVKDATNKRSQKQGLIYKALNDKGKEAWVYPKNAELRRKHLANWRHFAMQVKTEQVIAEAEINARSFGDDLQRMTNVVTWEANPSTAFGYEINNASPEVLRNFTAEARALLMDEDGNDTLAMMLGVPLTYSANGFGAYASAVSPNNLAHLLPARAKGQEGFSAEEVRAYARAIQYIFKQDAVPWFRPENKVLTSEAAKKDQQFKVINTKTGRLVPKGRFDTQAEAEAFAKTKGEGFEVRGGNLAKAVVLRYDRALESADLERILGVIKEYLGDDAGFTRTADNEITLINFRDDQTKLPWAYDEAFIKAVDSFADDHGAALGLIENKSIWTEGEYGYVQDWSQDKDGRALLSEGSLGGRPDLHPWLRSRRDAFEALIERYSGDNLAREQEGVTLFQSAPVRGRGPQVLRVGDVGPVRASYGEQKAGGSSVLGIHYSREPRESLSGHFYGTGIKGSEARRLALSSDPRLSQRIHFYVDTGEGIRPEPGVGSNIHAVNLNNVYNVDEDPLGLVAAAYADKMADTNVSFNNLESAIIDAGFDGIYVPRAQATKGVAVLLGDHADVQVEQVQQPETLLQQSTDPRGSYNQLKDGSHLVRLFERANASTMPHELAHAFLTELRAMAETGVADEAMLADLQKIEAWLDREAVEGSPEWQSYYEDGLAKGMNDAQARERATFVLRHEKFSRGFEQYLWEGKAPEPELEGIFARFSRWLKELYKDALAFGVNLDPEIRSVFDRMLKADAEVESKVMELGFTPMTEKLAKHLGLGPEDRDYAVRLYSAALEKAEAKLAQARNKGLRKLRAEWKKDAIEEANKSPVHQMLYTLRKGRGIDTAEFLALYGDEAAKGLPRGVLREGGLSLNEAAFEHNYDTHEQMVNDLWNYRKPEDIAAEVVEAKTAERDATFKVEDFILETAEFAAYQELMAKAYDKNGNVLSNKAFRDYARKIVATMPLADAMDVRGFLAAMARHHKAETKALKAGKLADAAKANKKARLNHAYAQEALNVRKRVEKAERMAKRLTKLKAGQIEEGYHKALLQLIQRFGLTKKDYSGLQDVPALADLVKLQDAFGADEEASFSQWILSGESRSYKDLTSGEFAELQDLMKFLYGTGKDLIQPTLKVSGLTVDEVKEQIIPQIEALPKRGKRRKEGTWLRKMQDQVQSYLSQNRTILWIIRELDGYTALKGVVGPLEKLLFEPLEAANLKRAELSRQLEKRTRKARAQLLKSATAKANKVSLVDLPIPPAWQRQGRVWDFDACLSVLMNMGNAVNRQRVMDGYNLTEQDLQQILAVFSQKDAEAVQDIWDAMDEILWPEIAGTHKKLRFYTPGKVAAEAFTMPDGTVLRGGYYPLKYDPSADTRAARNQDLDKAVQNPATAMLPKSVASGATKARAASAGGMPVLLRTSVLSGHLDWAVHYASHALVIHDLGRILGDKEIAEAMKTAAGEETFRAANELVKRIANPRAGDTPTFLDTVFGKLTGISAVYSMWMNRFGPLTQPTAIGNYIAAEGGWGKGTATWMKGAAHFLAHPAKQWAWLMENNAALKNHFTLIRQQLSQAIGEDFRDIQLGKTKSGRIWTASKETVIRGGIAMYGIMDAVVSVPGWYGSYLRGLDEGLSTEEAMVRANKIMAEYTPMSRDMDKTLFQHTKGMARAWTYMMSYFTKQANTNAGFWKAWRQGAIGTDQFVGQIVAVQILPAVVVSMMYSLLTGDDDDRDNILMDAGLEVAAYPFAGLPFAREGAAWAANLARAGITGDTKKLGRNAFQMPGMMYLQLMQRAGSTTYAMVQDFDDDEKQAKALMSMAELAAATAGMPPVPKVAKEVMRGLDDIDDDEGNILNVLIKPKIRKRD